jgi:hypothetical protein
MTKCPYCGDSFADLEQHLRRAFAGKKKKKPVAKFLSTRAPNAGTWHRIKKDA